MTDQSFSEHLKDNRDELLTTAKKTLHDKHHVDLVLRGDILMIEPVNQSAYKTFFALMLKSAWEPVELSRIRGFCAIIWLIELNSKPRGSKLSLDATFNSLFYHDLISRQDHKADQRPKLPMFHIGNIQHIINLSDPFELAKKLPLSARMFAKNPQHIGYRYQTLVLHAYIPFEHHQNIDNGNTSRSFSPNSCKLTVNNINYYVGTIASPDGDIYNEFRQAPNKPISKNKAGRLKSK
jgi:hypothetical protein